MLIDANTPLKDISRRLGHSSTRTTIDIYTKCTNRMGEQTVSTFENIL
ncbi:MAG: hypothetical protein IJH34_15310 [Romboutsia sp.]|nr:hypothetical protein [Romboutsia sp.]